MMRLLLSLCLVAGCGAATHPAGTVPDLAELRRVADTYRAALPAVQGPGGWIETDHCDATLWSGLLGAAGVSVDLTEAEVEPGRWLRRPADLPECWASGASRSTVSRDQLLGVLWWAWRERRLDVVERLWDFGVEHAWVMGRDNVGGGHTVMNAPMLRLLAEAVYRLGGTDHALTRQLPILPDAGATDFVAHLQALQLGLFGELVGGLTDAQFAWVREQTKRQPNNPLFHALVARYSTGQASALATLSVRRTLASSAWPTDRLPGSGDRCEPWVLQRDAGPDWDPCPAEGRTHSGGDFLFVLSLLEAKSGN